MLEVTDLTAHYGKSQILNGISLSVAKGEVVTLLGRNGMGKTTTLKSIAGLLKSVSGSVEFSGRQLIKEPSFKVARIGLSLVPEGRQIFPNLSVRENLVATAANRLNKKNPWDLERVLSMFPALAERLDFMGNLLSGGEQQMLAIGRALMTNPQLLLLDDATEGLAPLIRDDIWQCLGELKSAGLSILIVDKNLRDLAPLADRHYIIEKGTLVWSGNSNELLSDENLTQRHLSV
ncbi:MAG: ABC transporter ATP-binding protein [Granulosicoccus sp.]|nr:ABC transporter ATP-binding protein [Granulosicoccus sp.]